MEFAGSTELDSGMDLNDEMDSAGTGLVFCTEIDNGLDLSMEIDSTGNGLDFAVEWDSRGTTVCFAAIGSGDEKNGITSFSIGDSAGMGDSVGAATAVDASSPLSTSSANSFKPAFLSASMSVLQVTGCFPDPCIHFLMMFLLMALVCSLTISSISFPLSSFRSKTPNSK